MEVFPGDYLGCSEEFVAGENVYEEGGNLYSSVAGKVVIKDREISVKPIKEIPKIKKGDVVLGRVIDVKKKFALVELARKVGIERSLYHDLAFLPVSEVANEFVEDVENFLSYRDIIIGEVIDENLRISIKKDEYGVVKASCSCGGDLVLEEDKLKCRVCGRIEKRKISNLYGGVVEWK